MTPRGPALQMKNLKLGMREQFGAMVQSTQPGQCLASFRGTANLVLFLIPYYNNNHIYDDGR